jgi:hypothetical protein
MFWRNWLFIAYKLPLFLNLELTPSRSWFQKFNFIFNQLQFVKIIKNQRNNVYCLRSFKSFLNNHTCFKCQSCFTYPSLTSWSYNSQSITLWSIWNLFFATIYVDLEITLWNMNSLNNVFRNGWRDQFCFKIELNDAHEDWRVIFC